MTRRALVWMLGIVSAATIGGWATVFGHMSASSAITRDLPADKALFEKWVAREFPLPISEEQLVAELASRGFEVAPERATASFERRSLPCILRWRIDWKAEQGEVLSISPVHGSACP